MRTSRNGLSFILYVLIVLIMSLPLGATAESESKDSAKGCQLRISHGALAIVVCPADLDMYELRKAGVNACSLVSGCTAWIWDDPSKAPDFNQIVTGQKISKEQTADAVAIWDNNTQQMMLLRRVSK